MLGESEWPGGGWETALCPCNSGQREAARQGGGPPRCHVLSSLPSSSTNLLIYFKDKTCQRCGACSTLGACYVSLVIPAALGS